MTQRIGGQRSVTTVRLNVMLTVRRWQLAADLKRLREAAGLKPEETAHRLGISLRTLYRAEFPGGTLPKERVLREMLGLYGADPATTARLVELRGEAKQRGWWVAYRDVLDDVYVGLEDAADSIRTWQTLVVPGLLQTEEYARAIVEGVRPGDPDNARRVETRVLRRARFNGRADPPQLHALIDEGVLIRQVGDPEIMRDQISYLKTVSRRPNITIQIVPLRGTAHPGMAGSFVLLGFSDYSAGVAYVESRAGDLYPEDEPTLAGFSIDWSRIHGAALTPEESVSLLTDLLEG